MVVANTHLFGNPDAPHVRILQMQLLLQRVAQARERCGTPRVMSPPNFVRAINDKRGPRKRLQAEMQTTADHTAFWFQTTADHTAFRFPPPA